MDIDMGMDVRSRGPGNRHCAEIEAVTTTHRYYLHAQELRSRGASMAQVCVEVL